MLFYSESCSIMERKKKSNAGRKTAYQPDMPGRAYKLCLLGLKDKDLATAFGVNIHSIYNWQKTYPAFADAIKKGRQEADANVAKAMYQKAIGYSHPETKVLTNKITEYDEEGKPIRSYTEPLMVDVIKHHAPDAYAGHKWLALRQREFWAEVQKTEHTHKFEGQIDINHLMEQIGDTSQFTDEELRLATKLGLDKAKKELVNNN